MGLFDLVVSINNFYEGHTSPNWSSAHSCPPFPFIPSSSSWTASLRLWIPRSTIFAQLRQRTHRPPLNSKFRHRGLSQTRSSQLSSRRHIVKVRICAKSWPLLVNAPKGLRGSHKSSIQILQVPQVPLRPQPRPAARMVVLLFLRLLTCSSFSRSIQRP